MNAAPENAELHKLEVEVQYHTAHVALLEQYAQALEGCAKDANTMWRIDGVKDMMVHEKDAIAIARSKIVDVKRGV